MFREFIYFDKWDAIRNKIEENSCSIICIQEIKRDSFDTHLIRKFAPRKFDNFDFIPSIGASGGILVLRNSSRFTGVVLERKQYALNIQFTSAHNLDSWKVSTVYGPCQEPLRSEFVNWMKE